MSRTWTAVAGAPRSFTFAHNETVQPAPPTGAEPDDEGETSAVPIYIPVEEPADLEATDAEPLSDLVLGEVEPVVELGSPEHEPRLAREWLAPAGG